MCHPFLLSPPCLYAEYIGIIMEYLFCQLGYLLAISSSIPCVPPALHLWGGMRSTKGLDTVSPAQPLLKHSCVTNTVSHRDPKQSLTLDTVEKVNSVPFQTTLGFPGNKERSHLLATVFKHRIYSLKFWGSQTVFCL